MLRVNILKMSRVNILKPIILNLEDMLVIVGGHSVVISKVMIIGLIVSVPKMSTILQRNEITE